MTSKNSESKSMKFSLNLIKRSFGKGHSFLSEYSTEEKVLEAEEKSTPENTAAEETTPDAEATAEEK